MVLYNTTFHIQEGSVDRWRTWMNDYYLPLIRRSGYFETYKIMRLLRDDDDGENYCCQLYASTMNDCQLFLIEHEQEVIQRLKDKFSDNCLPFSTVLEITEEGEI